MFTNIAKITPYSNAPFEQYVYWFQQLYIMQKWIAMLILSRYKIVWQSL